MSRGSVPLTVLVFAMLGPALAAVLMTLGMHWQAVLAEPQVMNMALMLMPSAYLLGLGPVILTGVAAVWLSPRVPRSWLWAVLVAVAGALCVGVAGALVDPFGQRLDPLGTFRLVGPPAAGAALLCALICMGLRLRPRSTA